MLKLVARKVPGGFAPAMAVPAFVEWQVLSHAGTNIRFALMAGEALGAFWYQRSSLRV